MSKWDDNSVKLEVYRLDASLVVSKDHAQKKEILTTQFQVWLEGIISFNTEGTLELKVIP